MVVGVEDEQFVAVGLGRPISVDGLRVEDVLGHALFDEVAKDGADFAVDVAVVFVFGFAGAAVLPLDVKEHRFVEVGECCADVDLLDDASAPEGRRGDGDILGDVGVACARCNVGGAAFGGFGRLLADGFGDGEIAFGDFVHDVEAFEGVLGVVKGALVFAAEVVFDVFPGEGRSAEDDGHLDVAFIQDGQVFAHDDGGLDEQT